MLILLALTWYCADVVDVFSSLLLAAAVRFGRITEGSLKKSSSLVDEVLEKMEGLYMDR